VAESLLLKQQLVISSRARRRAPNLNSFDRFVFGLGSRFVPASLIHKLAIILKPRTLFRFHEALKRRKYRWLFSSGGDRRPGPKGPSKVIGAIVEFKRRNPRVGHPRIAQEIAHAFGIDIDKDIVRRALAKHYRPEAGTDGPSWLSFIGHMKDSLWSVDLFRCESILLRSHWVVMVVMDVFTRRIIGFGVERADPCGASICRMFSQIIAGKSLPRHLSSDHDPIISVPSLARNLRILEVEEIKSIPYVPVSPSVRGTADRDDTTGVS
jgi:putative transposase